MGKIGNYDFGGYVTKYNILCSDGRTIMPGAFKHCGGKVVPLTDSPFFTIDSTAGYVFLENCDDGVYGYGMFNDSPLGKMYKQRVEDGLIKGLGIYANQLTENDKCVIYGIIQAVMLCIYPANPCAKIDIVNKKGEQKMSNLISNEPTMTKKEAIKWLNKHRPCISMRCNKENADNINIATDMAIEALDDKSSNTIKFNKIKAIIDNWAVDDDEHELLEQISDIVNDTEAKNE